MIREVKLSDAGSIAKIYNHYISNTIITFEEITVSVNDMDNRIQEAALAGLPWLVAEKNGEVVGYAYASQWKGRCAYRFAVEVTVYLSLSVQSEGWGTQLYQDLFSTLKDRSIHVAIGTIALPNSASIALHEKLGMEKVGHFKEVGFKFDQWIDVGYWQVILSS